MAPTRRRLRLKDYDYSSSGAYFLTLCTHHRACLLGTIRGETVELSDTGRIVQDTWRELPSHCADVRLDAFVVMPNHLHAIVFLLDQDGGVNPYSTPGRTQRSAPTTLPGLVRRFKTLTTARAVRAHQGTDTGRLWGRLWQRGYYEHVIRN